MSGRPVKVAFLADTSDLQASLAKAESAMKDSATTATTAGAKIDSAFDSTAGHADNVASKGSQAAGALGGLGSLIGGEFGAAMEKGGIAMQGAADAGDLLNVVTESAIVKKGKDAIVSAVQTARTVATTVATTAQTVAQRALNAAMNANPIGLIITALVLLVGAVVLAYKKNEAFRDLVDSAWGKIKGWINDGKEAVVKFASSAQEKISAVGGFFGDLRDKVGDVIGSYKSEGGGVLGKLWSMVDTIGGLPAKIREKSAGMWDGLKDSFKSAINAVIGWWNNLELSIDIPDKIPGLPDSFSITTPNIPYLANGGLVTRATLAVIGEAGPEAVIPLSKMGQLGGGGRFDIRLSAEQVSQLMLGRIITGAVNAYAAAGGQ